MKIPKKLKIGAHVVKVNQVKLHGADGDSNTHTNVINLDSRLPNSQMGATLIHEVLHMLNATWSETREGHIFLESLSQQIYQVLSDNKLLR
jgi:hypothetical protein